MAVTDFNQDGKLDIVATNSSIGMLSILLGNGDGTFANAVNYFTGNTPMAVAIGDFNHDGITDLAVANQGDDTVSILLGQGGGTFGWQTTFSVGNQPSALIVADVNGDGNLDLAVCNQADNTVSVLLGNGDGTFAAHLDYFAGENPAGLIAADFNGDGKLDLAVANDFTPGGTVTILLNHGDGSFLPGVAYATGDSVSLVAADFDGDGILDFAAVNTLAQTLSVYLGKGDGTFKLGPSQTTRLAPNPSGLVAADINADGSLELVTAGNSNIGVTALANNNAATFSAILQYGAVSGMTSLAVGDFNNDGNIDMALASTSGNAITVLLQSPSATLSASSVSFGNVQVGGTGTQTVTLSNSGSAILTVGTVSTGGSFSQSNNCSGGIAPGNTCTITISFIPTSPGTQTGTLTITDNDPGITQTVNLSGVGATFTAAIGLSQSTIIGSLVIPSNTVTLSGPAPAGGWTVALSSSNPAVASVPASVTVAAGATVSSSFNVTTTAVAVTTPVTLTAVVNGFTATTVLTVNPIGVAFSFPSSSVSGGLPFTNSLTLNSAAPTGGLIFSLSSSNPAIASVPPSVTVAAGATVSPNFIVTTYPVSTTTSVTIFASLSGVSGSIANASLKVMSAQVSSVTLGSANLVGGLSATLNTVNLVGMAPPGGISVSLTSSKPSVAAVPATVTVPQNSSVSLPFTITGGYVSANTPVIITATFGTTSAQATITVTPDGVASVNLSPSSVVGGSTASTANTVSLLAAAPPASATVKLTSSNPAVAAVPSSVKVSAGTITSAAFKITTTAVSVTTPVTITASYNGIAVPVTLTVVPLAPATVNLGQTGVAGGKPVQATVTLNGAAPTGGITVSLSSSNPSVATMPASVTVAAGAKTSSQFTITTTSVTKQTSLVITATYQGNTATATLTVRP